MPTVPQNNAGFAPFVPLNLPPVEPAPEIGDTLGSAFRLNSDVVNLVDLMSRPAVDRDLNFNLMEKLKTEGLQDSRDNYLGVFSDSEFSARRAKIDKEQRDRALLMSAGWPGVIAAMGAGMISPTMLIPLTTGAKGLRAVAEGAGLGLFATGGQEMVLQAAQETRMPEESAWTVGTGTVLGAILGGAVAHFSGGEHTLEGVAKRMDVSPGDTAISHAYGTDAHTEYRAITPDEIKDYSVTGYHGTNDVIQVFDPKKTRLGRGVFFSEKPELASDFALGKRTDSDPFTFPEDSNFLSQMEKVYSPSEMKDIRAEFTDHQAAVKAGDDDVAASTYQWLIERAKERTSLINPDTMEVGRAPNVSKVLIKPGRVLERDLGENFNWDAEEKVIEEARAGGYDTVRMTLSGPKGNEVIWSVLNPDNIAHLGKGGKYTTGAERIIETPSALPKSVGAVSALPQSAGGLKSAIPGFGWANKTLAKMGPITRGISQDFSEYGKWMTAQFGTGGLRLEGNALSIPSAETGSIEASIRVWDRNAGDAFEALDKSYRDYFFGGSPPRLFPNTRAEIGGLLSPGKLSRREFNEAVGNAMFVNDAHATPEVAAAARTIREKLYKPLDEEARRLGVYEVGDEPLDESYLNRLYHNDKIMARFGDFVDVVAEHLAKQTAATYEEELGKLLEKEARGKQAIEDINLPSEAAAKLRADLNAQLKSLEENTPESIRAGEEESDSLRQAARQAKSSPTRTIPGTSPAPGHAELLTKARELEAHLGEPFAQLKANRATIRRRLKNLNKNKYVVGEKLAGKLERIDRLEELQLRSMDRVIRKAERVAQDLNKYSHEELAAKAEELRGAFHELAQVFDRGEEKLKELGQGFEAQEAIIKGNKPRDETRYPVTDGAKKTTSRRLPEYSPAAIYFDGAVWTGNTHEEIMQHILKVDPKNELEFEKLEMYNFGKIVKHKWRGPAFDSKAFNEDRIRFKIDNAGDFKNIGSEIRARLKKGERLQDAINAEVEIAKNEGAPGIKLYSSSTNDDIAIPIEQPLPKEISEAALTPNEGLVSAGLRLDQAQGTRAARLNDLANRIEDVESLDDDALRSWIADTLDEVKRSVNELNSKRAVRSSRLQAAAEKLGPDSVAADLAKIAEKSAERRKEFLGKYATEAASPVDKVLPIREYANKAFDITANRPDFLKNATEAAQDIARKILGTNNRIQGLDLIIGARGPEIARTLKIPSTYVSAKGTRFADFLVTDIEKAARAYWHTLAPDIEITRKFGSPDAADAFAKLTDEQNAKALTLSAAGKSTDQLEKQYAGLRRDLNALLERAKGTRGIPKDPSSFAARAGRVSMNLQTLRFMGTVLLSSVSDPARPIMKYGLTRSFRDGFNPFVRGLQKFQLAKREARLAGVGIDTIIHTRAKQIYDMVDEFANRSKFERGIEYASSHIGMYALFDRWTDMMKEINSSIVVVKASDSLAIVAGGAKASAKEEAEAVEFLAAAGIGRKEALGIWDEMLKPGGADEVQGVMMPNTEAWENKDAIRAFRTLLNSEASNSIVTPGFERPLIMDANLPARVLLQFKSFSASSTTKTIMAGLQQRDAHFVQGVMSSLALGAMSYYLWAVSAGGPAQTDMEKAGIDKWADEAIARSGVLAVFGEFQKIADKIPLTKGVASFSGKATTNRAGDSLVAALMGPSFDMMKDGSNVLMGLDQPTQSTLHSLRTLLPFQNLFWLRQAFDAIEKSAGQNLPAKRGE